MASNQQFCLRWNNHTSTLISVFDHLLESGKLVDCTLAAEGQFLKAHKVVLSACSPYLEALLSQHYEKHPILILKDVSFHELKSMLDYMYRGEVNISQEQLGTFLKAAESLQIKGLTDSGAISESRDFERSHDLDRSRDLNRSDRSFGVPKRMEMRKQSSCARSPLFGLLPNLMTNVDNKKVGKHSLFQEINSASPTVTRNREGSLSPPNKRKRYYPPHVPHNEEPNVNSNPLENNHHEENHKNDSKNKDPPQVLKNFNSVTSEVPSTPTAPAPNNKQMNKTNECENLIESDVVKPEVKSEQVDYADEVHYDDSVENLTVDEEEEEMDEADLSKPGPSNVPNSHVAGVPWHIAGEGNGEEILLAGQQESQGARKYLMQNHSQVPLHMQSWETWSALHPSVPNLLRGALCYTPGFEEQKGVECSKCGRHYKLKSSLRNHQKWECGKEPQFQCPYCNYRAKQKMHVARHIERMHREKLDLLESLQDRSIKEEPASACYQQDAVPVDSSVSYEQNRTSKNDCI